MRNSVLDKHFKDYFKDIQGHNFNFSKTPSTNFFCVIIISLTNHTYYITYSK